MLSHQIYGILCMELKFCTEIKVMQSFKHVESQIETMYQKSSFMRKPRLIDVLPSLRIREGKKCLINNATLHFA